MANSTLVYTSLEPSDRQPLSTYPDRQSSVPAPQQCNTPSHDQQTVAINGLQSIRQSFQQWDISSKVTNIILQSWSPGTQKQYTHTPRNGMSFKWEVNPFNPPLNTVLDLIVSLHEQGLSYTTINTARSALSAIILPTDNVNIGSHRIVSRFTKGHLQKQPTCPTLSHYMGC